MKSIHISCCLFMAMALAQAETTYGPWHHSVIGGGGYIQNVVLCPSDPQRAYAYVDNSGMFRSDDGGRSWRIIHGTLPVSFGIYDVRGLVVDPRDANKIVAAIGGQWDKPWGVFVSHDGGATWKQTLTANIFGSDEYREAGFILDRHPRKPDELTLATGGTGVFRSDDNGQTWRKLGLSGIYPTDLRYDRAKPSRLWVCAQPMKMRSGLYPEPMAGGFHRSEDGGATWRRLCDESPTEILQDPTQPGRIYGLFDDTRIRTSTDGGLSWQDLSEGLELAKPGEHPSGNHPHRYAALAAGPDFVLTASCMGQFYRLNSSRTAWDKIARQGLEERFRGREWFASHARGVHGHFGSALGSITVDPQHPDRWFFTDFYAIYQTTNSGRDWALSCDGVDATVLFGLTQDPGDPGVVHLGMADNGFFLSEDGGASFLRPDAGNQNTMCISVSRAQPSRVYAVGSGFKELSGMKSAQVWVSLDRGQTWIVSPMTGLPEMAGRFMGTIAADPRNPFTAYLTLSGPAGPDDGGVWRTRDGGRSWEWIGQGLPAKNWFFRTHPWGGGRQLAVGRDGSLIATGSAGTYRLAGGTWLPAAQPPTAANEIVADPHHAGRFLAAGDGVWQTEDAGATWSRIFEGRAAHIAMDETRPGRVAVGLAAGIALTADGGKTWAPADARLPFRHQPLVAFAGERLLAGTVGNGCFWLPLSDSGARKITAASQPRVAHTASQIVTNWNDGWTAAAGVRRERDGTALVLQSETGRVDATITKTIGLPPGAAEQALVVGGRIKTAGELEQAILSVYCDGAWEGFANAPATRAWREFSRAMQLPAGATKARLQLTLKGRGAIWLDDLHAGVASVWKE